MKIAVWIAAAEPPRWPMIMSLLNMKVPEGAEKRFIKGSANNVFFSWNDAVQDFLDGGDDWLFSVHADVQFEPETLPRLLANDKPLVSALVFHRTLPPTPHVWSAYEENPTLYAQRLRDTYTWLRLHPEMMQTKPVISQEPIEDALYPISFTSTTCCVIHRSVFEKVPRPWFLWTDQHKGGGEDCYFFRKAAAAGFQAWIDRSVIAGHLMTDVPSCSADFVVWGNATIFHNSGEPELVIPIEKEI